MAEVDKECILTEIEDEKQNADDGELKQYNELQGIIKQIDLSVLQNEDRNSNSCSSSKKRKIDSQEKNDAQITEHMKELEATAKQIDLVKKALTIIYSMENTRFTKYISKYGDKPREVTTSARLINQMIENGKIIPLWIGKTDEDPPILCGAIEADANYIVEVGNLVAAFVNKNWILAEVIAYDRKKKEYTVDDIYEEQKMKRTLNKEEVIPLPKMRADPRTNPGALFPENASVLALFPQTTCFYPAVVSKRPEEPHDPYLLSFKDDAYETGYAAPVSVHQRYVIHCKDYHGSRKKDDADNEKIDEDENADEEIEDKEKENE